MAGVGFASELVSSTWLGWGIWCFPQGSGSMYLPAKAPSDLILWGLHWSNAFPALVRMVTIQIFMQTRLKYSVVFIFSFTDWQIVYPLGFPLLQKWNVKKKIQEFVRAWQIDISHKRASRLVVPVWRVMLRILLLHSVSVWKAIIIDWQCLLGVQKSGAMTCLPYLFIQPPSIECLLYE